MRVRLHGGWIRFYVIPLYISIIFFFFLSLSLSLFFSSLPFLSVSKCESRLQDRTVDLPYHIRPENSSKEKKKKTTRIRSRKSPLFLFLFLYLPIIGLIEIVRDFANARSISLSLFTFLRALAGILSKYRKK